MIVTEIELLPAGLVGEEGHCWTFPGLDPAIAPLRHSPLGSRFTLFEDDRQLGPDHARLPKLRETGGGQFFYWNNAVYFSTSDNSDPRINGRRYRLVIEQPGDGEVWMPTVMSVGLTYLCNLTCRICRTGNLKGTLTDACIDKLIEEAIPHLTQLRIDVAGEPTLHQAKFRRIVTAATKLNVPVFLCTNATLIDPDLAAFICDSSINIIQLSVDSPNRERLEWVRRGASFDAVVMGIRNLVAARLASGRTNLQFTIHAALLESTIDDMPDLVRFAHDLGVEEVNCMFGYIHDHMDPDWSVFWDQPRQDRRIEEAKAVAAELGVKFMAWQTAAAAKPETETPPPPLAVERAPCHYLYQWTYVDPSGSLIPCCISSFQTGNLSEHSFEEIWRGETYMELRRTHNTATPSDPKCAVCYLRSDWAQESYKSFFHHSHWPAVRKRLNLPEQE